MFLLIVWISVVSYSFGDKGKPLNSVDYVCPGGCIISNTKDVTLTIKRAPSSKTNKCKLEKFPVSCPCGCNGSLPSGNIFKIEPFQTDCDGSEMAYIDDTTNSCSCGCINQKSTHHIAYNLNGNFRCKSKKGYLFPAKPIPTKKPSLTIDSLEDFFTSL